MACLVVSVAIDGRTQGAASAYAGPRSAMMLDDAQSTN
jgi:hypothetical protein